MYFLCAWELFRSEASFSETPFLIMAMHWRIATTKNRVAWFDLAGRVDGFAGGTSTAQSAWLDPAGRVDGFAGGNF